MMLRKSLQFSSGLFISKRWNSSRPSLKPLSEDEESLRSLVQGFAEKEVRPLVSSMDESETMSPALIEKCFSHGLMGIETPAEYGGADQGFFGSILAIEELAKVDPSVSVMVDVQNTLVNNAFFRWGTAAQKEKYLPALASNTLGSFCLSEAGSGSDAFALKTRAEKKGNVYHISGNKLWITNSGEADLFLIMANVDPSQGYKGITCFIARKSENPGAITIGKKEKKLGIRASSTCEVIFDNLIVPEEDVLGEVGQGYKIAIEVLNEGRIGIGAQMLGLAEGAFEQSVKYTLERNQFGVPISSFQAIQQQQADCALQIEAAKLLVYNAARMKMNNEPFVKEAAMAKLYASQVAESVSSKAIEWMGGVGFVKDYPVEKFYRDAKIGAIYEGTSNIQRQTIAKIIQSELK